MTTDSTSDERTPIPTPAEVHHEHPTVLVPVPPSDDVVRKIETHDDDVDDAPSVGEGSSAASPATATPVATSPAVTPPASSDADAEKTPTDTLAQDIADAASAVPGVHGLGSATARAVDSARMRLLGRTGVPGVNVVDDEDGLSIGVALVAEYPANVTAVADSVRAGVASVVGTRHTGPVDIDVTVTDVHGPFDPIERDPADAIDAVAASIDSTKTRAGDALDDAKSRAKSAIDDAKVRTSDAMDDAKARTADLKADAAQAMDDMKDSAADALDRAKGSIDAARDDAADRIDDLADDADDAAATAAATDAEPVVVVDDSAADDTVADDSEADMAEAAAKLADAANSLATAADSLSHEETVDVEPKAGATVDAETEAVAKPERPTDLHPSPEQL